MRTALATVAALLLVAATAQAATPSASTSRGIAQALWGPAPCGDVAIRYDDWTVGRIAYSQPMYDDLAASPCAIHLSPDLEGRVNSDDAQLRCHAIVHEWGHLTGHHHTRTGIMARTPHGYYWRCRQAAR